MRTDLLFDYLKEQNTFTNMSVLKNKFRVSEKTIRNEIDLLNKLGLSNGFVIERVRSKGFVLIVEDDDKFKKYIKMNQNDEMNLSSGKERVRYIETLLIQSDKYISSRNIAEKLGISNSTVRSDLSKIEPKMKKMNLQLISKKRNGFLVVGDEDQKRKYFSEIIDSIKEDNLDILINSDFQKMNLNFNVDELYKFLKKSFEIENLNVSSLSMSNIIQHIIIMTFRISRGNNIKKYSQISNSNSVKYLNIANRVSNYIEKTYEIHINSEERKYLCDRLYGKISSDDNVQAKTILNRLILEGLDEIDSEFLTEFKSDENLINALLMHIIPLLKRTASNIELKNPLIDDIYTKYANVFTIAYQFVKKIEATYKINIGKDEIGYIAVYFAASLEDQNMNSISKYKNIGLIYSNGDSVGYLLKSKIQVIFPKSNIFTGTVSEINDVSSNVDLIISTEKVERLRQINVPVIYTNLLLADSDVEKILTDVKLLENENELTSDSDAKLLSLFNRTNFEIIDDQSDYIELLRKISLKMVKDEFALPGFEKAVVTREKLMDTVYKNGVAGPHPIEQMAKIDSIYVCILKRTISYKQKEIKVIFLTNIKKGHLFLHKDISNLLIGLMDSKRMIEQVQNIQSFDEFIPYINELIERK